MKYCFTCLYSFNTFTVIFLQLNTNAQVRCISVSACIILKIDISSEGKQWSATTKFNVYAPIHPAHIMESAASASTITEGWVKCPAVFTQDKEKKHTIAASTCSTKTDKAVKNKSINKYRV